jgi:anti-sigma factor RsiW
MSRQLGHPRPVALARLQTGLADPYRRRMLSAHVARCPRCARVCTQLDAVSAALWAAPVPPVPAAAERRVLAALAPGAEPGSPLSGKSRRLAAARRWRRASSVLLGSRVLIRATTCMLVLCLGIGYVAFSASQVAPSGQTTVTGDRLAPL